MNRSSQGAARKIATLGLFISLGMIIGYLESLIPMPVPFPGFKLGLANVVTLVALYREGGKSAAIISIMRVVLLGIMFQTFSMMVYGLFGCVFSLTGMILLHRTDRFSINGISVAGGVLHNLGQITAAWLYLGQAAIFGYFPVLMVVGSVAGFVTGALAKLLIQRLDKLFPQGK